MKINPYKPVLGRKLNVYTYSMEESYLKNRLNIKRRILTIVGLVVMGGLIFILLTGFCWANTLQGSWYSVQSLKKEGTYAYSKGVMANGRVFKDSEMTCATRLYPLGTKLIITNLDNNKSILVVVTDRIGKRFAKTRIDLSKGAFMRIANIKDGLINISVKRG